jgi:hypothetical protein
MKFFDSHWERARMIITPAHFRIGLALLSLVALVLGGAADDGWDG